MVARLSSTGFASAALAENSSAFGQDVPPILCRSNAAATSRPSVSNIDHYDDLVLGSGEAAKYIARTLANEGRRVAVVERELIGGSCPNVACLPSKNVIYSNAMKTGFLFFAIALLLTACS